MLSNLHRYSGVMHIATVDAAIHVCVCASTTIWHIQTRVTLIYLTHSLFVQQGVLTLNHPDSGFCVLCK